MATRVRTFALAPLLAATACFTYQPAALPELEPGETVRAYLTREAILDLNEVVTVRDRTLTGRVVQAGGDGLLLDVAVATADAGSPTRTLNQRIGIPTDGLLEVEERTVDALRTGLAAASVAALIGTLIAWQITEDDNSPGGGGKDPPDALRMPAFRISIPLPGG